MARIPTTPAEYSDELVRAWGAGRTAEIIRLADSDAAATLKTNQKSASTDWTRRICEGAAGSSYCTYDSPTKGTMTVRVGNEAVAQRQLHAVIGVQFGPVDAP